MAGKDFEIRITVVDADPAALPAVSAALLRSSNRDDQFVALQTQANLQVSDGPTLHIQQDGTDTGESDAARIRVSAHPHLNADGAEAVDITVEQVPAGTPWAGEGSPASLVFTNGETRLVSDTLRPDGRRHLLYATVFFPAGATKACARPSEEPPIPLMH